jgi:hypothetical protein
MATPPPPSLELSEIGAPLEPDESPSSAVVVDAAPPSLDAPVEPSPKPLVGDALFGAPLAQPSSTAAQVSATRDRITAGS